MNDWYARRRAYALLSELVQRGVEDHRLDELSAIEVLGLDAHRDLDALAAEHHRLFSLEVFPFAGVFLDPSGLVGGRADNLGAILDDLASGAGAPALDALLGWLPPFAVAVRAHGEGLYRTVVELVLELAIDHRAATDAPVTVPALPESPALDDPDHDLRAVARVLTTPCHSGFFVSRSDVLGLGRGIEVPVGFGGRARMLENLWQGAAEYQAVHALIDGLLALARERSYRELDPRLAPWIEPWARRLGATEAALVRMQRLERAAVTRAQEPCRPRLPSARSGTCR